MGTIIEKIQDALDSKAAISAAIEAKGVTGVGNVLSAYAGKIMSIVELKGETKTVTPTTSQQTINPSSGKNGITQMTILPVTSSIDANIVAGNIKDGVSILGVTGDYQGSGGSALQGYNLTLVCTTEGDRGGYVLTVTAYHPDGTFEILSDEGTVSNVAYFNGRIGNYGDEGVAPAGNYNVLLLSDTTIYYSNACLLAGTKITLADNSEKNIEDITYDDELLVWDFDNCCFSTSKPIWIKKEETENYWFENKYKSGKVLKSVGKSKTGWGHRVMDMTKSKFIYTTESIGDLVFTLDGLDLTESCQRFEGTCKFYNIITEKHFNLFANRILTSCSLNNMYLIEKMKYVKDNRQLRTIEEYSEIPQRLFDGLRLAENMGDIETLNEYVHKIMKRDSVS